jgi:hypothetical protein
MDFRSDLPVRVIQEEGDYLKVMQVGDVSKLEAWRINTLSSPRSFNNRLIVEAYQKKGLQSSISNGFAFVEQKVSVKGLQVLMDAKLADGTYIQKGSTAYIKEELLHTAQWAQKILESDTFPAPFIIVDMSNVEYIVPPSGEAA